MSLRLKRVCVHGRRVRDCAGNGLTLYRCGGMSWYTLLVYLRRGVAQLVEQRSPKPQAAGSNPVAPANFRPTAETRLWLYAFRWLSASRFLASQGPSVILGQVVCWNQLDQGNVFSKSGVVGFWGGTRGWFGVRGRTVQLGGAVDLWIFGCRP